MCDERVEALTPSSFAAPFSPETFHFAASRARMIFARSSSSSSFAVRMISGWDSLERSDADGVAVASGKARSRFSRPVGGRDYGPLNHVLQFPHVSGPTVILESAHIVGSQRRDGAPHLGGEPTGKGRSQTYYVVAALAQRRQAERKHVQPVEEILTEFSLADGFLQIAIRRGQYPDVHLLGGRAADRIELALLEHAEQFRLQVERQFPDLVEKNGALVGQGKATFAFLGRARKGPPLHGRTVHSQ